MDGKTVMKHRYSDAPLPQGEPPEYFFQISLSTTSVPALPVWLRRALGILAKPDGVRHLIQHMNSRLNMAHKGLIATFGFGNTKQQHPKKGGAPAGLSPLTPMLFG